MKLTINPIKLVFMILGATAAYHFGGPSEMRLLTYSSKGRAEAGFKGNGFYSQHRLLGYNYSLPLETWLEAVPIKMTLEEI